MILKGFVEKLGAEKGKEDELALYELVERLAPKVISGERTMYKGVSANVDFYSGFVYRMLELPEELYPTIFAIARIVGWSAHRMEELANNGKIIRPAYMAIEPRKDYVDMDHR
jgi:citrate synthase